MEVIGLAGGVASGKSTVAGLFAELGAVPLDADRIGHAVLLEGQASPVRPTSHSLPRFTD
ncbi:MAG: dephospho-CoA kinase [Planctomycetota bacterium]